MFTEGLKGAQRLNPPFQLSNRVNAEQKRAVYIQDFFSEKFLELESQVQRKSMSQINEEKLFNVLLLNTITLSNLPKHKSCISYKICGFSLSVRI